MNSFRIIPTLLFLALWSNSPHAESKEITILAPISCQDWLDAQSEKTKVNVTSVPLRSHTQHFWLLGLVTGLNANYPTRKNLLSAVDGNLVFDWMDNYCSKNKSSSVFAGANALIEEISKRK
jgi:hypothetical protein